MATTVVHIRKCPRAWKTESAYLFIGRPGKWGNPFPEKEHGRKKCIDLHEQWLVTQTDLLLAIVHGELEDKTLVCYCKPLACHGDTLLTLANLISQGSDGTTIDERYKRLVRMLTP